jgi:hypothetical protein
MEQWQDIPTWEHRYEVSDTGKVRSKDMKVGTIGGLAFATRKGRLLVQIAKNNRYLCVTLAQKNRREQWLIHDLVLLAFVGPKPKELQVLHADDDKSNNHISNLRYGTRIENEADRKKIDKICMGEKHGCSILTNENVWAIRLSKESNQQLAEKFKVGPAQIWSVRTRRSWKHI